MYEWLGAKFRKVRIQRDGARWFASETARISLSGGSSLETKQAVSKFLEELSKEQANVAVIYLSRSDRLNPVERKRCAHITVFDWGFRKSAAVDKVRKNFEKSLSLAGMAGLDFDATGESDWDSIWLMDNFLMTLAETPPPLPPNPGDPRPAQITIGQTSAGANLSLELPELCKHMAVLGETGSGKSTFVANMLKRANSVELRYLVFDWHGEYPQLLKSNQALVVAPDQDLGFDIFDYPKGVDPFVHIDVLMDIFNDSFDLTVSQQFILRTALRKVYTDRGHGMSDNPRPIDVDDVMKAVTDIRTYSGWEQESKLAVLRRISKLADTGLSRILNASQKIGFSDLLNQDVIVDLGQVTDSYSKIFVVESILKLLYDYKVSRKLTTPHAIAVEEARNIIPYRRPEEPPRIMERIVEELRKFGESMIIINQLPSTLSQEVLTAVGNVAAFRLKGSAEQEILERRCSIAREVSKSLAEAPVGGGLFRGSDNNIVWFES